MTTIGKSSETNRTAFGMVTTQFGCEAQEPVTAEVEGSVTNQHLQQFSSDHTTDITQMLQDLVAKGFLVKDSHGRWASYRLGKRLTRSGHNAERTPRTRTRNSGHKDASSQHRDAVLGYADLLAIAAWENEESKRLNTKACLQLILVNYSGPSGDFVLTFVNFGSRIVCLRSMAVNGRGEPWPG